MNYVEELLIGKCGFYCGSCPTYIKGQCSGCVEGQQVGDCFTKDCVEKRGLKFCGECSSFPCEDILSQPNVTALDKKWLMWKRNQEG